MRTGVKQGCMLSPLLFSFHIDWLTKETTITVRRGITGTLMVPSGLVLEGLAMHMSQDRFIPNEMSQENTQDFLAKRIIST